MSNDTQISGSRHTHSYVWHDSLTRGVTDTHLCAHLNMWSRLLKMIGLPFIVLFYRALLQKRPITFRHPPLRSNRTVVTSAICMGHVTHMNQSCHTSECIHLTHEVCVYTYVDNVWSRLLKMIGLPFIGLFYRALLQKRPITFIRHMKYVCIRVWTICEVDSLKW